MNFVTQLLIIALVFVVVAWVARARLLALVVSWIATTQHGRLTVSVESLSALGEATQVLVTLADGGGLVKDVQCRRLKIGWTSAGRSEDRSPSSDVGSDGEGDEGGSPSGLQKLLLSLSRMRVHIQLVGVRVRLRAGRGEGESGDGEGGGDPKAASACPPPPAPRKKNMNMSFLLKSVLPFVSVDVHDVEVLSYAPGGSTTLLRGRKVGVELRRSEQVLVLEHVFVCPGARGVKDDQIYHECGLVELDSACAMSVMSLHDLLGSFRMARRKRAQGKGVRATLDVNSLRVNVDPSYIGQLEAVFGGGTSGGEPAPSTSLSSSSASSLSASSARTLSPFYGICGEEALPVALETSFSSVMLQVTRSGCAHVIDLKGTKVNCQTTALKSGVREGRLESSASWDNVSVSVGATHAVAVECQSSRAESTLQVAVSSSAAASTSSGSGDAADGSVRMDGGIDVGALHTKVHHEHLGAWLQALQAARAVGAGGAGDVGDKETEGPKEARGNPLSAALLCNVKLSLGNGSSMQFVDCDGVCMLHQSLDAASIVLKRVSGISEAKFEVSGIAMAEETQASRSESQVEGGVQRLRQVLSSRSFSGGVALEEHGDAQISVSVNSLAGKVSRNLMKNACSIAGSVLEATGTPRTARAARTASPSSRRRFSLRADLLDVDLAVLSTYVVEKRQSSLHAAQTIRSALALRIKNFGLSRTTTGLCKANSDPISVLYYEGTSEEEFSLDFDAMEGSIRSKPLVVQRVEIDDVASRSGGGGSEQRERRVAVGPVHVHADADALMSMVHFSKSMDAVRSPQAAKESSAASPSEEPAATRSTTKTIVAIQEMNACIPVSSDREVSLRVANGSIEHDDGSIMLRVADAAALIKGVETLATRGVRVSFSSTEAKSSVAVHADDAAFILPHDRDPGPTLKIFSLYVKACKELVADVRRATSATAPATTATTAASTPALPDRHESSSEISSAPVRTTEINLSVTSGKLVFEHHPLERWFAGHSGTIRHAALVEHLWDEAHTSVMYEGAGQAPLTPLHSGKSESEQSDKTKQTAAQPKSWRNLMSRHASSHIKQLSAENKTLALYEELFQVDIQDVKLHAISDSAPEDALAFVHAVDEPSRIVAMKSSVLFQTNLSGARVEVKFGGCNRPLYAGTGVVMHGRVALAKQATASPQTCGRVLHVGLHHVKEIDVPLRGTCPPMKVFTDVFAQTETSSVFFSPGLEPVLGLMGVTSKRLVPSDPDSISKKPPPVPWWDDLRYFWRGMAQISSKALSVVLVPGLSPTYSKVGERLEIDAEDVSVALKAGDISLETGLLRMMAFRKTLEENGGQLCVFPVADVKSMVANILVTWRLPDGADPMNHYVFESYRDHQGGVGGKLGNVPAANESAAVPRQQPVFVAEVYKASALDVVIDVSFRRNTDGLDPPMLYIGGEIVSFWRKFVRDWEIPTFIKNQVRRGTFFVRKPKLNVTKKGLPKLLQGLKVNVDSEVLHLTHFTLDGKDPGGGLLVGTTLGRWEFAWDCNTEIKGFLTAPPNASGPLDAASNRPTKTIMSHLAVAMERVTVKSLQFSGGDGDATPPSIFKQGRLATADSTVTSISSDSFMEAVDYDPTESHWLAERVAIVKSMSDEADRFGERHMKPLKVTVEDCYFMTDLELRDAIWATVEHLIAAFAPSKREAGTGTLRSALTPGAGIQFQRSYSRHSDLSNEDEENELLSLLLQQKQAEGSSSLLASPQGTVELDRHESANAEADILPMTTSHDDSASELKYEVEVSNMQLILQRDSEMGTSRGRLLLATKSATLTGATTDAHTITTLGMEDVQAYISLSSVDPSAQIAWLDIAADTKEFIAPSVEERESLWRRVFNPISMNLRHSKFQSMSRQLPQQQPLGPLARQGEELLLKIPEIAAVMDGREFEVLIDVVSFLITSGPTVNTCNSVRDLRRDDTDSNSKVANEQMLLELSSRQLVCIRSEATCLLQGMPDSQFSGIWSSSEPLPFSGALKVTMEVPAASNDQPSDVLRKYIERGHDEVQHNTTLLLRWSQEQEHLALEDYNMAKSRLEETSERLKRQTQVKSASRVLIHLNRVVWQLCDQERVPFVQASIKKAVFDRRTNRDRSGSVRFTIHRLDVLDATGILPEGPATSAGVILTTWNPESSYEREPMLRVISTLGVPTSKYDVFEHLDATLHPLTLHLTEQIATSCWEYFFPKEDQKSRQEAFSTSIGGKKLAPSMAPSPRKSSFTAPDAAPSVAVSVSESSVSAPPSASSPLIKQESDVSTRSREEALRDPGRESFNRPSPSIKRRDSPMIKRKKSTIRLQKRFKYVKLNRAHMRITYAGKPIGIKDRVLVINSYACENLDGTWRDLLSNVKQKAIFSALFSGLGLQGRKVKELMIGAAPSIKSVELPTSEEEDLANNRGLLAKFGLKYNYNQAGSSQRRKADDPETQKKRALFGDRLFRRPTSNPNSPREDAHGFSRDPRSGPSNVIERKHAAPLRELQLDQPLPPEDSDEDDDDDDSSDVDDDIVSVGRVIGKESREVGVAGVAGVVGEGQARAGPLGAGLSATVADSPRSSASLDAAATTSTSAARPGAQPKYDPHAPPTWIQGRGAVAGSMSGPMERLAKATRQKDSGSQQ